MALRCQIILMFVFQEVFLIYNGKQAVARTTTAKMYAVAIASFQAVEMICYLILFRHIMKHDEEMKNNNIISADVFTNRRRVNIFSLRAQVLNFAMKSTYSILSGCFKIIGRRYFPPNTNEYGHFIYMIPYPLYSAVPILASTDLRKKFFEMFHR